MPRDGHISNICVFLAGLQLVMCMNAWASRQPSFSCEMMKAANVDRSFTDEYVPVQQWAGILGQRNSQAFKAGQESKLIGQGS